MTTPDKAALVTVDREGALRLPREVFEALPILRPEPFAAFSDGHSSIHLLRLGKEDSFLAGLAEGTLALAGSGDRIAVAEIFSLLHMGRRTGVLVVVCPDVRKAIHFRRGEIIHASSEHPEEQLDAVLYRTGKLGQQTLELVRRHVEKGERSLLEVLLEEQLIEEQELWWGVQYQVEEILYSVFSLPQVTFLFFEDGASAPPEARLSIDTNSVLMEGYRRLDEWARIERAIPSSDRVLLRTDATPPKNLDERARRAFSLVDGRATAADIVRQTGWGELRTYQVLFQLSRAGLVEVGERTGEHRAAGAADERRAAVGRLGPHLQASTLVGQVLRAKEIETDRVALFNAFQQGSSDAVRAVFHGADPGGSRFRAERLLDNALRYLAGERGAATASQGSLAQATSLVRRALAEWTNFQCFAAYNLLPASEARELATHAGVVARADEPI